jgi:hypothetical protein
VKHYSGIQKKIRISNELIPTRIISRVVFDQPDYIRYSLCFIVEEWET